MNLELNSKLLSLAIYLMPFMNYFGYKLKWLFFSSFGNNFEEMWRLKKILWIGKWELTPERIMGWNIWEGGVENINKHLWQIKSTLKKDVLGYRSSKFQLTRNLIDDLSRFGIIQFYVFKGFIPFWRTFVVWVHQF